MKKFVFTSNIRNEEDKDLLNFLAKEAEAGQEETYKCSFLASLNKENIVNKVKELEGAILLLIPTWISLDSEVQEEISFAKKQGVKLRLFSHWQKEDVESVFSFFQLSSAEHPPFLWNKKIFAH